MNMTHIYMRKTKIFLGNFITPLENKMKITMNSAFLDYKIEQTMQILWFRFFLVENRDRKLDLLKKMWTIIAHHTHIFD
jgi:hypothetical protein